MKMWLTDYPFKQHCAWSCLATNERAFNISDVFYSTGGFKKHPQGVDGFLLVINDNRLLTYKNAEEKKKCKMKSVLR